MTWEKEPKRTLNIQNASLYQGNHGKQTNNYWHNTDKVFIVNGFCNKADGNFMTEFKFAEIGDTGIVLGSYPSSEEDIRKISQAGCTAIMDIQTSNDHLQRGIDVQRMKQLYQKHGITNNINYQVSDIYEAEYCD